MRIIAKIYTTHVMSCMFVEEWHAGRWTSVSRHARAGGHPVLSVTEWRSVTKVCGRKGAVIPPPPPKPREGRLRRALNSGLQ